VPQSLFLQNVIAIIWDFDRTLIPGYMQEPLFRRYDVNAREFWTEVAKLARYYKDRERVEANRDTAYLNHLLTYVREGRLPGLSNALLRELGTQIRFYPGLPDFFPRLKDAIEKDKTFSRDDVRLEHYIVSTGLRQMILGSEIAPFVESVWGCEFIESPAPAGFVRSGLQQEMTLVKAKPRKRGIRPAEEGTPAISQLAYVIDNTTKTRAIFEINKGSNKERIDVNAVIRPEDRRVPFQNMIYIADGPSDVPVFSIVNHFGGRTYAVYGRRHLRQFRQVKKLQEQGRVQSFGEADYTEDSHTSLWIRETAKEIAWRIVYDRAAALKERVHAPPGHIVEEEEAGAGMPLTGIESEREKGTA